jgi:HemY protein
MLRVLGILIVAVVVVAAAWYVAGLPGEVTAQAGNITFQASVSVVATCLLAIFILLYVLFRLIGWLLRLPRNLRAHRATARHAQGEVAVTRALVALAAAEPADARRETARARRLLGDTPQTLLLAAEAGRIADRPDEAQEAFRLLAARRDAAFLGYRGLLRHAIEQHDWTEAAALARQAEEAHPGAAWLRNERAQLAIRSGNWREALALADADTPKAALATAAAEAETDPAAALRVARIAWKEDPTFAPAALTYARRLRGSGRERRAQAVLRQAWAKSPMPDIAELALTGTNDPMARHKAAQRLVKGHESNVESRMLLARTALDAGLLEEARRHANFAREDGLNQRRLWLLLAQIEEQENGSTEEGRLAQRDYLRKAASAEPDPGWLCTHCRTPLLRWLPVCPACGTVGTVRWVAAETQPVLESSEVVV